MASVSVEVQVWDEPTYVRLVNAGSDGVVVYQETYDRDTYADVHLKGKKRNYEWRLAAPDRAAAAGARKLGVAALLGLHGDWRSEAIAVAAHARALEHRWWRAEVSVSVPRMRPAAGDFEVADPVDDRAFTQLICALRLALPDTGMTVIALDAPDSELREMTWDIRVLRDVVRNEGGEDVDTATVYRLPPEKHRNGMVNFDFKFTAADKYILLVKMTSDDGATEYVGRHHFTVGLLDNTEVYTYAFFAIFLIAVGGGFAYVAYRKRQAAQSA